MSLPAPRPASYEDLLALPENVIGEIIAGVLYTQPRPAGPHTFVASGLGVDLGGPFDRGRGGPGGWFFGSWADEREARIEPFDAVPLDLIRLWESTGLRG